MKRKIGRFTRQALAGVCALSMMMSNFTFAYAQEDYTASAEEVIVEEAPIVVESIEDDCCCDDCCEHEDEHEEEIVETEIVLEASAEETKNEVIKEESNDSSVITEEEVPNDEALAESEPTLDKANLKGFSLTSAPLGAPAHEHKWDKGEVTIPATCTEDGLKTFRCTKRNCNETKTEIIPKTGHNLSSYLRDFKAATCTEDGYESAYCYNCSEYIVTSTTQAKGHNYVKWYTKTAASCMNEGVDVYYCTRCYDTKDETTEKTDHKFSTRVSNTVPSTCTEAGYNEYKCTTRGCTETKREYLPLAKHNLKDVKAKAATCTEAGYKKYKQCTNCDYKEGYEEIEPLGHAWNKGEVTTQPTYHEEGVKTFKCTRPGCNETKTEVIPKLVCENHNYVVDASKSKAATCQEAGLEVKVCSNCGDIVTTNLPKVPHNFKNRIGKVEAWCEREGCNVYQCEWCSEIERRDIVPPTGHTEEDVAEVPATCTTNGHKAGTKCSDCGKILSGCEEIPATGHDWQEVRERKATCVDDGHSAYRKCLKCDAKEGYEFYKATGHNYSQDIVVVEEPTCTTNGVRGRVCSKCGWVIDVDVLSKKGHDFSIDVPEQKATCTEDGHTAYKKCSRCDATDGYEVIKATGHDMTEIIDTYYTPNGVDKHNKYNVVGCSICHKAPNEHVLVGVENCTGKTTSSFSKPIIGDYENHILVEKQKCEICNRELPDKETPVSHEFKLQSSTEATCTTKGVDIYTCSLCHYNKVVESDPLNHDFSIDVPEQKATCTEDGHSAYKKCSRCDATEGYEVYKATGHDMTKLLKTEYNKKNPGVHEVVKIYGCQNCDDYGEPLKETTTEDCNLRVVTSRYANLNDMAHRRYWKQVCDDCGYESYENYIDEAHVLDHHVGKAATCTENGWEAYDTCKYCDYTSYKEIPAGHTYEKKDGKAATCTEDGYTDYEECSICHDIRGKETIKSNGQHDFGEWYVTEEATCQHAGLKRRDCKNCSHYEEEVIPQEKNHKYVKQETIAPTCTEEGYDLALCKWCNKERHQHKVDPLGHDLIHHEAQAPTCTEIGWEAYDTCSRCDYSTYVEIEPTGHDFGEWYVTEEATCQHAGLKRRDCNNCSHYEEEVIPKEKNHQYVKQERIAPTCTEEGYDLALCKWCNAERHQHKVDPLGHDLIHHEAQAPTCTEIGWEEYDTCSRCDYSTYVEIEPTGHDFENGTEIKRVEPTCTKDGYYVIKCANCNETETHTLNKLGHKYGEWYTSKEPTCTELGYERRDCQNEGCHFYQSRAINELGHDLIDVPKKDSTCLEDGYEAYKKCSRCEYTEGYEVIPAKGHDFENGTEIERVEPTCTKDGYYVIKCANCNETETHTLNATGHKYGEWYTSKEPTCTELGYERRDCQNEGCHSYQSRAINELGHDLIDVPKKDSTCLEDGYEAYKKCSRCEYTEGYEVIPAKGHDFTVHVKGSDSYVSKDKNSHTHYWTNKCSRCEETEIEQEVLKHNFVMVDDKKPTCKEKGYTTYKCKECNYKYTVEVPALGHSYGNLTKEIVKAPTTESEGRYEEVKYCERCNDRYVINSGIIPKLEKEEPAPLPAAPTKTDKKPVETKVTETEEIVSDVTEETVTEETVTEEIAEEVVPEAAPEITKEEETPEVTKAAAEEPVAETETETEETNAFCWWWLLLILIAVIIATSIVIYARRKNNARR